MHLLNKAFLIKYQKLKINAHRFRGKNVNARVLDIPPTNSLTKTLEIKVAFCVGFFPSVS